MCHISKSAVNSTHARYFVGSWHRNTFKLGCTLPDFPAFSWPRDILVAMQLISGRRYMVLMLATSEIFPMKYTGRNERCTIIPVFSKFNGGTKIRRLLCFLKERTLAQLTQNMDRIIDHRNYWRLIKLTSILHSPSRTWRGFLRT